MPINRGQAVKYISDLVRTVAANATRPGLRSAKITDYHLGLPVCLSVSCAGSDFESLDLERHCLYTDTSL